MTTRAKVPSPAVAPLLEAGVPVSPWPTTPWTMEERLKRIEAIGQRISGYIQVISQIGSLNGNSAESKERAVTAFYERMVLVESQLVRIQEDLRLG